MYQRETHTGFYWANLMGSDPSVDLDIEGRISKRILNKYAERAWNALIWFIIIKSFYSLRSIGHP